MRACRLDGGAKVKCTWSYTEEDVYGRPCVSSTHHHHIIIVINITIVTGDLEAPVAHVPFPLLRSSTATRRMSTARRFQTAQPIRFTNAHVRLRYPR